METVLESNLILDKSKAFAVRIIKFYKYLCEEKKEFVLSKQILRSGTSIGANARESKNAQSKADFIHKLSIALKEADETAYWFELLTESGIVQEEQVHDLYEANIELIKIMTAIIKTSKKGRKKLRIDNG
ncbi:MAG: four helix bundle protein [Treponema sp.]|nr:four helix bundle protein [Treponema sp.]